jgi:predicted AAA+ superfamily ATPase
VFDRLYEDWSTLDNFQRTRGVLKLMAKVIHRLWKDNNADPLIMPGSVPLYDADVRNEAINYLPQGWDPVLERDIDGERAETTEIENKDTLLGSVQACRRTARSVFLGARQAQPASLFAALKWSGLCWAASLPGQTPARYKDALKRFSERLHYLNTRITVSGLIRAPTFAKRWKIESVASRIRKTYSRSSKIACKKAWGPAPLTLFIFSRRAAIFLMTWLCVLLFCLPDAAFSRTGQSIAIDRSTETLKNRGDQPRQKQNRLIFLAADYDSVSRLKDQVRSVLAWQSIVDDYRDNKIVIDNLMANTARASLDQAQEALRRMIREAYKWVLAPMQEARNGRGISDLQWENFQLNASSPNLSQEIERVLKENELLISEWAPIHLTNLLKAWFWKDEIKEVSAIDVWQKTCCYLYLPRLKDEQVFRNSIAAGTGSQDFFGVAYAKEADSYVGFSFGKATTPILDGALLLIEPVKSAAYAHAPNAFKNSKRHKTPQR